MLYVFIFIAAQEITAVDFDTPMRYLANTSDPGIAVSWVDQAFDDSTWEEGFFTVGYNAGSMVKTQVAAGTYSVYTRSRFNVTDPAEIENVFLGVDFDDGFVAWINGVEVLRDNMPPGVPAWDEGPTSHESSNGGTPDYSPFHDITEKAKAVISAGENVLAVGVWNTNSNSSDLALAPNLIFNRPPGPVGLSGTLTEDTTLTKAGSPYLISGDLTVPKDIKLTIEPGVKLLAVSNAALNVEGEIIAEGTEEEHIVFSRNSTSGHWSGVNIDYNGESGRPDSTLKFIEIWWAQNGIEVNDIGDAQVLVEDSSIDCWSHTAVTWHIAHGFILRRCRLGLDTPDSAMEGETIHGYNSGALMEYCEFGRRKGYNDVIDLNSCTIDTGSVPVVRYCIFNGGEDDAIDYDGCDGWIIGNLIMNHQPPEIPVGSANGGGVTGNDASQIIVMNNIIYNCYHAVGYKNGADCLVINNTIINCHVGITVYKQNCSNKTSHIKAFNNILWGIGRDDQDNLLTIVDDSHWWPAYCQRDFPQGTIEVSNSIIEGGWTGENVIDADPMLADPAGGDFTPLFNSPAIDAGAGSSILSDPLWSKLQDILAEMGRDKTGEARIDIPCIPNTGGGDPGYYDIGAVEFQDIGSCGEHEGFFERGDANGDGKLDISDAIFALLYLFEGAETNCQDAIDTNDDGSLSIADPVWLLSYLFSEGETIPAPFPGKGIDTTEDNLTCEW